MIVLLSWLIANLEILFLLFLSVITFLRINNEAGSDSINLIGVIIFYIYFIFSIISSAKSFLGGLFIALMSALVYLYLHIIGNDGLLWTILTPTLIVSIVIGVFTFIFKESVISRRMLYVNSGIALFEFSLLYALNRFFSAFSCMTVALLFYKYFDEIVENLLHNI